MQSKLAQKIIKEILASDELTNSDLLEINRILKAKSAMLDSSALCQFSIGNNVYVINPKTKQRISGKIIKINKTKIKIQTKDNIIYNVPAAMLKNCA